MSEQLSIVFQAHSRTSRAAARSIAPASGTLRAKVLETLRKAPLGLTDEEIQAFSYLGSSTERPRRIELVRAGLVKDSGRTRPGHSGREMTVWVVA